MKQIMSVICFSLMTLCLVACSMNGKKVDEGLDDREDEWTIPLSNEQVAELNEYFKALTVTHFADYEEGDDCSLQLLNFSSQLLQLDYPAMVEPMWPEDEAYASFDKKMMFSLIEQYFNQEAQFSGIYIDLGDYVARPDIKLKTYQIYPEIYQCQFNDDGTYTIDLDLYEVDETVIEPISLIKNWHQSIECHQVGVASVTLQHDGNESYIISYHPIYFE